MAAAWGKRKDMGKDGELTKMGGKDVCKRCGGRRRERDPSLLRFAGGRSV